MCTLYRSGDLSARVEVENVYRSQKNSSHVRGDALKILGWIGDKKSYSLLIKALDDPDNGLKYRAAEALGSLNDKRAFDALLKKINHTTGTDSYAVRSAAAESMIKLDPSRAYKYVVVQLDKEQNVTAKSVLLEVLGNSNNPDAYSILVSELESDNGSIRFSAARALGSLGDKRAISGLAKSLYDSDFGVRQNAAKALGNMNDKKACIPLLRYMKANAHHVDGDLSEMDVIGEAIGALIKLRYF